MVVFVKFDVFRKDLFVFNDVTFFEQNENCVWTTDNQFKLHEVSRSIFYPLHQRPFSGMWLPRPRDPRLLLQMKYTQFKCKQDNSDHKNERLISLWNNLFPWLIPTLDCRSVEGYYPFVHRTVHKEGVKETLKIGELDIYKKWNEMNRALGHFCAHIG